MNDVAGLQGRRNYRTWCEALEDVIGVRVGHWLWLFPFLEFPWVRSLALPCSTWTIIYPHSLIAQWNSAILFPTTLTSIKCTKHCTGLSSRWRTFTLERIEELAVGGFIYKGHGANNVEPAIQTISKKKISRISTYNFTETEEKLSKPCHI